MGSSARMYVCDNPNCSLCHRLLILPDDPRPRCDDCWLPLYELPTQAHMGSGIDIFREISARTGRTLTQIKAQTNTSPFRVDQMRSESLIHLCIRYGLDPNDLVSYDSTMQTTPWRESH